MRARVRRLRAALGIQIYNIANIEVHIARKMTVGNLCTHCVEVANVTNFIMKLNKVLSPRKHCYGIARIYGVQARPLNCSLDLQWPVVCRTPVVFREQLRKFLGVALDLDFFKAKDKFQRRTPSDENFRLEWRVSHVVGPSLPHAAKGSFVAVIFVSASARFWAVRRLQE